MTKQGETVIEFRVSMFGAKLRANHAYKPGPGLSRLKDQYAEQVWCAGRAKKYEPGASVRRMEFRQPWPKAHLILTQKVVRPQDEDNFIRSPGIKALIDTLHTKGKRPLGIVVDDSPDCLTVEVRTEKVAHKAEEAVVVRIEKR